MPLASQAAPISKKRLWAGRVISAIIVLFLLFDSITKLIKVDQVLKASARLGYPESLIPVIGVILLACIILYVIPQTCVLGAILLTGYLGGAVASNLRAGDPLFETIFPIIFGVLAWAGLFLRDDRLHASILWRG